MPMAITMRWKLLTQWNDPAEPRRITTWCSGDQHKICELVDMVTHGGEIEMEEWHTPCSCKQAVPA